MQGDSIAIGSAWFLGHRWDKAAANASLPPTGCVAGLVISFGHKPRPSIVPVHRSVYAAWSFLSTGISMTSALPFDVKRNNAPATVKCNSIDKWEERGFDVFAANPNQLFLDALGIVNAFDP